MAPAPSDGATAWAFDPGDCGLARRELSGPGVFAVGETRTAAIQRLVQAEEVLHG